MGTKETIVVILAVIALAYAGWAEYWKVQAYRRIANTPSGVVIVEKPAGSGDGPLVVLRNKDETP